jgi:NADH pyrophosphatase NudC (nudix superfamily)
MTDARTVSHSMPNFRFCPRCGAPLTPGHPGDDPGRAPRQICSQRCGFVHYDNPTPVVAAVVEHDGKVLLARNKAWPATWYALVAGFLERDETPEDAVLREVREEVGLEGGPPQLIGVYPFARMNQVILAYHVTTSGQVQLGDELVDYKLVAAADCRAWRAGTGWALRDWLRAKGFEPEMTDLPG